MAAGVLSLPSAVLNKLVQRLEISSPLGRDWKGLAAVLGFNSRHTLFIEERSSSRSRTSLLLSAWDRSGRSSVEKLVLALYCLPHEGCLRILRPELPGLDYPQLEAQAARLRASDAERQTVFPLFGDEYAILPDQWPASSFLLSHGPPTTRPAMERENPLHSSAAPAQSPDEEGPSLSATPSQATGVVPFKKKAFISYCPDSSSRPLVEQLAHDLAAIGITVVCANEREMRDVEFKSAAIASCYNIVVFFTPRYCREYDQLCSTPSLESNIKIDRILIQNMLLNEKRRLILVSPDQDCYSQCVPSLFQSLPLYRYPSRLTDLRHCVADVPKFTAPPPEPRISIAPTRISFSAEVREFRARNNPCLPPARERLCPQPLVCSGRSPHQQTLHSKRIVPTHQTPTEKKSLLGRMFKKR